MYQIQKRNPQHKAHPRKMLCCKLNIFFIDFFHKHPCDGLLYETELDDNIIIVCEKCKIINHYNRFNWTCPKCGKRFKDNIFENDNIFILLVIVIWINSWDCI